MQELIVNYVLNFTLLKHYNVLQQDTIICGIEL